MFGINTRNESSFDAFPITTREHVSREWWQHADSIGMCVYADPFDPFENAYVNDLMRNALDALANQSME